MDKTVATVLQGFLALNAKRREEFIAEINKHLRGEVATESFQKSIRESANTINFGPAPTGCPCCGK
jgi:hypothetical protein